MDRDGRDSDDAEWLLAQLASSEPESPPEPTVAPPPAETPVPASPSGPRPRHDEDLDWFSLAEPAPEPDAAAEAPAASEAAGGSGAPAAPPGPVTPNAPFALTWGSDDGFDSEDSVRAAFRTLSEAGPDSSTTPERPDESAPDAAVGPSGQPSPPSAEPPAAVRPPVTEPAPSPFAGYTPPAVARQTFTPVGGTPIVRPSTPPAEGSSETAAGSAVTPPAWTPEPPRHPIAPSTAPAGWDERRPRARSVEPASEAPEALREGEPHAPATPPTPPTAPAPQATRRAPFPAFAAADDADRRESQPSAPVDDLLAALGGGIVTPSDPSPATPVRTASESPADGAAPPSSGGGLAALGIPVGDDPDDDDAEPTVADDEDPSAPDEEPDESGLARPRGRRVGAATSAAGDDGVESPIAKQIAETGYFWNLTPDPSAPDPKADAGPIGLDRPSPLASPDWPADGGGAAPVGVGVAPFGSDEEPAPGDEDAGPSNAATDVGPDPTPTAMLPRSEVPEPPAPTGPTTDAIAALFAGPAPIQAASAPASASAAGSAGAAGSPFAATAAATGAVLAATAPPTTNARPSSPAGGSGGGRASGTGGSGGRGGDKGRRTTRTLLWIAGGLVMLVVLAGLFLLGMRLASTGGGSAASGSPDAGIASATPVPVPEPTAVQPPGVHPWNALFGGECIDPFASAWENEYTVVDCAAPHAAQLVHRGEFADDAAAPFPGEEAIAAQMGALCQADGIIDPALVQGMDDLQVQASFPVTEEQWASGERTYYCFANRGGGEPLTGSITGPGPAA